MIQAEDRDRTSDSKASLPFLRNEASLREFIQAFEQGTLPRAEWTHSAHLAVASWYLLTLPEGQTLARVRDGIRHYNECAGIANTPDSGYHETLTIFWLSMVADFLRRSDGQKYRLAEIRRVVEGFGTQRDLYRRYYSFDVAASREARRTWVAPDCP